MLNSVMFFFLAFTSICGLVSAHLCESVTHSTDIYSVCHGKLNALCSFYRGSVFLSLFMVTLAEQNNIVRQW